MGIGGERKAMGTSRIRYNPCSQTVDGYFIQALYLLWAEAPNPCFSIDERTDLHNQKSEATACGYGLCPESIMDLRAQAQGAASLRGTAANPLLFIDHLLQMFEIPHIASS